MAFLALGINHKTASVDVRERVAFTPEQLVEALQQLCRLTDSREAAILSTCNRSELYIEQEHLSADVVLRWLADYVFAECGVRRLQVETLASREGACEWYERGLKMRPEGVKPSFGRNGESVACFSRLRGE